MDINLALIEEIDRERFFDKIFPEPMSGCDLWDAAVDRKGYGMFSLRIPGVGRRPFYAHRVAWIMDGREMLNSDLVCHKCDTPLCVRPDHLFLGTHLDNNADMARKWRGRVGRRGLPYGVSPAKRGGFCVQITHAGKFQYYGHYRSLEEAAAAALAKKAELYGTEIKPC